MKGGEWKRIRKNWASQIIEIGNKDRITNQLVEKVEKWIKE